MQHARMHQQDRVAEAPAESQAAVGGLGNAAQAQALGFDGPQPSEPGEGPMNVPLGDWMSEGLDEEGLPADEGSTLSGSMRTAAEASLGVGLGHVRVHEGADGEAVTQPEGAMAVALGGDIYLGPDVDNDLNPILAHEVAHAAQQRGASGSVGPASGDAEVEADTAAAAILGGVETSVSPQGLAVQHFDSPEHRQVGDSADGAEVFTIDGVEVTSGEVNMLADYYGSVEALMNAKAEELGPLLQELRACELDEGRESSARLNELTDGRYGELSLNNGDHFAPSDPSILPDVGGGVDHVSVWADTYGQALALATASHQTQDPALLQEARLVGAFSEHYLCDAFSSGHLFNKDDAMALAASRLDELTEGTLELYFGQIAASTWKGSADTISEYEAWKHVKWWPMNTADRFQAFMAQAYAQQPEVVFNGIVGCAHDLLSDPEGLGPVPVENDKTHWDLVGDHALDGATEVHLINALETARGHVDRFASKASDPQHAIDDVHGLFPRPTEAGKDLVGQAVDTMTTPSAESAVIIGERLSKEIRTVMEAAAKEDNFRRRPDLDPIEAPKDPGEIGTPDRVHIVKAGDTLFDIAEDYYDEGSLYPTIFEANKEPVIKDFVDEDLIEVGWRIAIPALSEGAP